MRHLRRPPSGGSGAAFPGISGVDGLSPGLRADGCFRRVFRRTEACRHARTGRSASSRTRGQHPSPGARPGGHEHLSRAIESQLPKHLGRCPSTNRPEGGLETSRAHVQFHGKVLDGQRVRQSFPHDLFGPVHPPRHHREARTFLGRLFDVHLLEAGHDERLGCRDHVGFSEQAFGPRELPDEVLQEPVKAARCRGPAHVVVFGPGRRPVRCLRLGARRNCDPVEGPPRRRNDAGGAPSRPHEEAASEVGVVDCIP